MGVFSGPKTVTLTGADDTCHPSHLVKLSQEFPFVEWGILIGTNQRTSRFPSAEWIQTLADVGKGRMLSCSLHICGSPLRSILNRDYSESGDRFNFLESLGIFSRFQLNFHGQPVNAAQAENITEFLDKQQIGKQVVIQLDGVNDWLVSDLNHLVLPSVSGLFDQSHGTGVLPGNWPEPRFDCYTGYAGGLGPSNLREQLVAINNAASGEPYWIDMESSLYDQGTGDFSHGKCREVLEIVSSFVSLMNS